MKPYTNKDRWRHIKHFIDTHPYSESNLEYLKNWLTSFTNESMTTENASSENRSHERKTKDESTYFTVSEAEVLKDFIKDLKSGLFKEKVYKILFGVKQ